ncbi:MAG: 5-formyltetrahydrofolate cyclo-ligase [Polyangiaceae bacterium]|nr:5-formyltetrahydrofolate cyclo-ligase [Polyangiaceae bacterium]
MLVSPLVAELEKSELEALLAQAKRQLRTRMKGLRSALPPSAIAARSAKVIERLGELPALASAQRVALFWPITRKNELDLRPLDAALRARGVRLCYPFMTPTESGFHTGFRWLDDPARLEERGRGFMEPPAGAPEAARGEVDLVVVPALAASADGHRIGYGIGYYDVTLPDVCPPAVSVIVAFSFQLLAEAPHDQGDFACDWVVTDERVIDARSSRGPA